MVKVWGFRLHSVTFRFGPRQSVRPQPHSARTLHTSDSVCTQCWFRSSLHSLSCELDYSSIRLLTSQQQLCEASSPSTFYVGASMNAPELELLFRELSASPDFCTLTRSIQESHTADHPQQNGERLDDKSLNDSEQAGPPDDLLCSARTLFEQCQQMTCTTSDTTLAVKGLTDQAPVLMQVHRCAYRRCVYRVSCGKTASCLPVCGRGRCVLAARSPFFQALVSKTWTEPSSENIAVSTEEVTRVHVVLASKPFSCCSATSELLLYCSVAVSKPKQSLAISTPAALK